SRGRHFACAFRADEDEANAGLSLILDGQAEQNRIDPALCQARARCWFEEVASGKVASLPAIARHEGLRRRYVTRLSKLAFVAPAIAEAIAAGPARPLVSTCRSCWMGA